MNSLEDGDWVRTENGDVGKIVLVTRLSAFVELNNRSPDSTLLNYLLSDLSKIEPPPQMDGNDAER